MPDSKECGKMKINLAVVFGGKSVEHEVAIISAVQAMNHINKDKYNILPIYISKNGEMLYSQDFLDINIFKRKDLSTLAKEYANVIITKVDGRQSVVEMKKEYKKGKLISPIDVVLPVVHGTNCEDGTIQGWLELLDLPYANCNIISSAIGMDKDLFKLACTAAKLPTLPHIAFYSKDWVESQQTIIENIESSFAYPVIVKPANLGSSIGISKAKNREELLDAIDLASSFAPKLLVEKAITKLREINCSVLGDSDECKASECEEPFTQDDILSFQEKYLSSGSSKGMTSLKRKLPADITDEMKAKIQDISCKVFKLIDASGVVRIDYLIDCEDDSVYINEINTIPGSLSFYLWEATGLKYADLLDKLVELAFKRARTKKSLMFTYQSNILESAQGFGAKGAKGSKM